MAPELMEAQARPRASALENLFRVKRTWTERRPMLLEAVALLLTTITITAAAAAPQRKCPPAAWRRPEEPPPGPPPTNLPASRQEPLLLPLRRIRRIVLVPSTR